MLEIQSYRIGKWFIYLWAKVHISLTNSSYIFDEWFIYLSILEVIGNNAKCIYILEKKYLQMRSQVPANFPLSKKYFSLKGSFFGTCILICRYFLFKKYIHFVLFIKTFAVQRYMNYFSKIYESSLKDIGSIFQRYMIWFPII